MQTFPKKRIEIIIETPLARRLAERLQAADAPGYTILRALGGSGRDGAWSGGGLAGGVGQMTLFICIVDAAKVDAILEPTFEIVSRQIGIISIGDVEVVRGERF